MKQKPRTKRGNKFGAKKVYADGYVFDSQREHKRYQTLSWLVRAGQIRGLELHPKFDLVINGIKVATYIGDFKYFEPESSKLIIEDVKGGKATQTAVFRLKWKIVKVLYPEYDWRIIEQ